MPTLGLGRTPSRALVCACLAATLAVAGCSSTDDEPDPDTTTTPAEAGGLLPPAEGTVEYPLTLSTPWGETVLEERPERIAMTSGRAADTEILAALGGSPVLSSFAVDNEIWTMDALPQEIELVYEQDLSDPTPPETIASVQPDLIVALDWDLSERYDQLAAIAPVLGATTMDEATPGHWRDDAEAIGEALDLTGAVEQVFADNDALYEQVRADYPQFEGLTSSYVMNYGNGGDLAYFNVPGSDEEQFFLDLGFSPNPNAPELAGEDWVSPEMLHLIDADVLVFVNSVAHGAEWEEITDQELYQNLDAVQQDHLLLLENTGTSFIVDGEEHEGNLAWALGRSGPLGQRWAAETLAPLLADVLD